MNRNLQNDYINVTISDLGAEIQSIKYKNSEYLWQGDSKYWARRSPVLFPIVGALVEGTYFVDTREYELPQHGFLRDRVFEFYEIKENAITLRYTMNQIDYELFPFKMEIYITYTLDNNRLIFNYQVVNLEEKTAYFSIGGHPAFNVDLEKDNIEFKFPKQKVQKYNFDGYITGREETLLENLNFDNTQANKGATIYSDFTKPTVTMYRQGKAYLQCDFASMKYLAFWSPENLNAPFVCIEPWNGIADFENNPVQELSQKTGIITLSATETYNCQFSFTFL